ncbi:hypothetical protein BDW22DRAFT_473146 [Trametopsis cervina]|nr:hypothetical protein BDW22DRAFT_473146 [Trametopsis cervina]
MSEISSSPSWPSLYNIFKEIQPIANRLPVQPGAFYLEDASDVYKFTLYWTLVFYMPAFMLCGTYAFVNLAFTPESRVRRYLFLSSSRYSAVPTRSDIPLRHYRNKPDQLTADQSLAVGRSRRPNARRSRVTFALLVLFTFTCCAVGGAVVGSAVLGYVMAGVFKAANYHMSTWIPLLLALIQTLVGFLGVWPSVVDII